MVGLVDVAAADPASTRAPGAGSRQRAASDLRQQPLAGRLHEVEDLLEAARRPRSRGRAPPARPRAALAGRIRAGASPSRARSSSRASALSSRSFSVHGQQQIEALEVLGLHLARACPRARCPARGGAAGAGVRRAAHVPGAGPGGVELDLVLEALADRRASASPPRPWASGRCCPGTRTAARTGPPRPLSPRRARAPPGRPPGAPPRGPPASSVSCPPSGARAAFSCA